MAKITSLWMGDLDPYMDERFIQNALTSLGEPCISIRIIPPKIPGMCGCCFLEFGTEHAASQALNKLQGVAVPGTHPVRRFRLNWANSTPGAPPVMSMAPDYTVFIGDLTADVNDFMLQDFFRRRFPHTIAGAKVVLDESGMSRGFGFVKFSNEDDMRRCLLDMQGISGCGDKPLRISQSTKPFPFAASTSFARPGIVPMFDPVERYQVALEQHRQVVERLQQYQQYQQAYLAAVWQACQQKDGETGDGNAEEAGEEGETYVPEPVQGLNSAPDISALNKKLIYDYNIMFDETDQFQWGPIEKLAPLIAEQN